MQHGITYDPATRQITCVVKLPQNGQVELTVRYSDQTLHDLYRQLSLTFTPHQDPGEPGVYLTADGSTCLVREPDGTWHRGDKRPLTPDLYSAEWGWLVRHLGDDALPLARVTVEGTL